MFFVRDVFFDAGGGPFADAWERVLAARRVHPGSFGHAELFVLDHPRGKPSVCEAIVRALPELAAFRTTVRGTPAIATHTLSRSTDLSACCTAVAAGIPRRFSARWCILALGWADALGQEIPADHRGIPAPGQDMHPAFTGLKLSRRIDETWLCASFALGPDGAIAHRAAGQLEAATALLGAPKWTETRVLLDAAEVRTRKAARKEIQALLEPAPRVTPQPPAARSGEPRYKSTFDRVAARLGYARDHERSESRLQVARRSLESGNLLELRMDAGGAGTPRLVSIELSLLCLGWPPCTFTLVPQTPIPDQASLADALERAAALVPAIERERVPRLEARTGGSPAWFQTLGRSTLAP